MGSRFGPHLDIKTKTVVIPKLFRTNISFELREINRLSYDINVGKYSRNNIWFRCPKKEHNVKIVGLKPEEHVWLFNLIYSECKNPDWIRLNKEIKLFKPFVDSRFNEIWKLNPSDCVIYSA